MGIQSLDQEVLSRVRRCHSSDDALAACERVLQQGFLLNVDLIFGLPGQTEESFARDFERLVERGVSSISVYNLRINERTPVLRILGREEHLEFLQLVRWRTLVQKLARAARFEQPRWHTFARPVDSSTVRFEDRTGSGDQLGIGVSARSRLGSTIYRNNTRIKTYLERIDAGQSPVEEILRLGNEEHGVRFITQTLGVGRALERAAYQRSLGRRFDDDFGPTLSRLHEAGLLIDDGERVELSSTGRLVHDLITLAFYPEQMRDWLRKRHLAALDRFAVPA